MMRENDRRGLWKVERGSGKERWDGGPGTQHNLKCPVLAGLEAKAGPGKLGWGLSELGTGHWHAGKKGQAQEQEQVRAR